MSFVSSFRVIRHFISRLPINKSTPGHSQGNFRFINRIDVGQQRSGAERDHLIRNGSSLPPVVCGGGQLELPL